MNILSLHNFYQDEVFLTLDGQPFRVASGGYSGSLSFTKDSIIYLGIKSDVLKLDANLLINNTTSDSSGNKLVTISIVSNATTGSLTSTGMTLYINPSDGSYQAWTGVMGNGEAITINGLVTKVDTSSIGSNIKKFFEDLKAKYMPTTTTTTTTTTPSWLTFIIIFVVVIFTLCVGVFLGRYIYQARK